MAPIQAVLVSSRDEDVVTSLTNTLRDQWPVRTATTPKETRTSLDDSVAVVIFDPRLASLSLADLATMIDEQSPHTQILRLGRNDEAVAGLADAVIARGAEPDTVRSSVDRLQRRARYDKLLSRFYSLARAQSERATGDETGDLTQELEALKYELDEIAAGLDDEDLFDVAVGGNGETRR